MTDGLVRLEGPTLPPESQGRIVPWGFGRLLRDVPGIPLQVGREATLATNCGVPAETPTPLLELSGPDLESIRAQVPIPGVVALDGEWMRYEAFLVDPYRLVITARGLGLTEPAAHGKGTTVLFVEAQLLYVFLAAPPGLRYPDDAVVQVRINDSAQVPAHTIRLRDERVIPGIPLVTVEFDLTRPFATLPATGRVSVIAGASDADVRPDPVARAAGRKRRRLARQGRLLTVRPLAPLAGGIDLPWFGRLQAGTGPRTDAVSWIDLPPPPAPAPPPETTPPASTRRTPIARPTAIRTLGLPLGRVTADLRGLLDTTTGRYTGTPSAPLLHPTPITRCLLEHGYGQAGAASDEATWATTDARQRALGLTWRLRWEGQAFEAFRTTAGYCGQADLYVDDEGRWAYRVRERQAPAVATLTEADLVGELALAWIPELRELGTRLAVTWGDDPGLQGGAFELSSIMARRYGRRTRELALPWMATEAAARAVARYWLTQWERPRQTATVQVAPPQAALTRTDRVRLATALTASVGGAGVFQVRGTTDRGLERVLTLVEADPPALECWIAGRLVRAETLAVLAHGRPTATEDVPALWRAALPGSAIAW